MRHFRIRIIFIVLATLIPLTSVASWAMHHEMNSSTMPMAEKEPDGMAMSGDMILVGNQVQQGIMAMVHLKDVQEAMTKLGMAATHHLMVRFVEEGSNDPVETGSVALKITDPSDKISAALPLEGMQGHFGGDIQLSGPGQYHFAIGTKLADGNKRQFDFDFTLR